MSVLTQQHERRWLSLGAASHLLDMNLATLRQWADQGFVRTFRTPGGHRRFLSDDLISLLESNSRPSVNKNGQTLDTRALRRIRRRIAGQASSGLTWRDKLDETGRMRLRLLGRRLLGLAVQSVDQRHRWSDLIEEATLLGEEHGIEAARGGLPLHDAIEAFLFFRNSTVEALRPDGPQLGGIPRMWRQISRLSDIVLVAMTRAYELENRRQSDPSPSDLVPWEVV